jgi:hypothetical protein
VPDDVRGLIEPVGMGRPMMAASIRDYTKKNRPAKTGTMVGVRMQDDLLARLDEFRGDETRPEAIRRLVEESLSGSARTNCEPQPPR